MRLIFYIIIAYIIYMLAKKFLVSTKRPARWERAGQGKGDDGDSDDFVTEETVLDPVCGSYVAKEIAIKAVSNGKTHYFCSDECRDKFNL